MFLFSFDRSLCEFLTTLVRRRLGKRQSHILRQNSKHLSVIKKDNQRIIKEMKRTRDKKMDEYAVLFGLFSAVKQHAPTTTTQKNTTTTSIRLPYFFFRSQSLSVFHVLEAKAAII